MRAAATALLVGRGKQFEVMSRHIALADTHCGHIALVDTHCTGGHIADVARIRQQQLRTLFCASAFVVSSSDPAATDL